MLNLNRLNFLLRYHSFYNCYVLARNIAVVEVYVRPSFGCATIRICALKLGVSMKRSTKTGSFARLTFVLRLCASCKCVLLGAGVIMKAVPFSGCHYRQYAICLIV